MWLGEPLCCSLGFVLPDLWLLGLQPEMLVFQCSDTKLCKKLIRHHWNCIIYRQNGHTLSDVTKQRSRLLEKAEETLLFLARRGWVIVLWRQVLRALQTHPLCDWTDTMVFSWCHWQSHIVLLKEKWQHRVTTELLWEDLSLCDTSQIFGPFKAKHHSASSTSTQELVPALMVSSTNHQILWH